jgi:flagella basal body P-ring formation protein FlgA
MIKLSVAIAVLASPVLAESLIAARVIRPNAIIEHQDIAIADNAIPGALSSDANIVGMEATVTLYPGRPILASQIRERALIERNQVVRLLYRQGGLTIEIEARALSRAAAGETVRMMNLESKNTISGRVMSDGSVQVPFERALN